MKRVAVFTLDPYLFKKIALSLGDAEVTECVVTEDSLGCDCVFIDIDTSPVRIADAVTMSRRESAVLSIPFSLDAPSKFLADAEAPSCALMPERRSVFLFGEEIHLTELEYALFELIVSAGEDCVSRKDILERIWHSEADGGVINVYVHYLREKLERGGEKIIVASRGKGYTLSDKYRALFGGGAENA